MKATLLFLAMSAAPVIACAIPTPPKCDATSWEGVWETNWGIMKLHFNEDETFTGVYGPSRHAVRGALDPNDASALVGTWTHSGTESTGLFRFTMVAEGIFGGAWTRGDKDPAKGGGAWSGKRPIKLKGKPIGEAEVSWTDGEGKRWINQVVEVENNTGSAFYVYGYSKDQPFIQIWVKDATTGKLASIGRGYCGTGAGLHKIERGASFKCYVGLREDQIGDGFLVGLTRYPKNETRNGIEMQTNLMKLDWKG